MGKYISEYGLNSPITVKPIKVTYVHIHMHLYAIPNLQITPNATSQTPQ